MRLQLRLYIAYKIAWQARKTVFNCDSEVKPCGPLKERENQLHNDSEFSRQLRFYIIMSIKK